MPRLLALLLAALSLQPLTCNRRPAPPPRAVAAIAAEQAKIDAAIALYRRLGYPELAAAAEERERTGHLVVTDLTSRAMWGGYDPLTGTVYLDAAGLAKWPALEIGQILGNELFHHLTPGEDTEAEHRRWAEWRDEFYARARAEGIAP